MGKHDKHHDNDPTQNQGQAQANLQGQIQGQANLQGQLQGQGQGQGQGQSQDQTQTAVQSLNSTSENHNGNNNWNGNDNWNGNGNENWNENGNENTNDNTNTNTVDNSLDNCIDNNLENNIENHVTNTVDSHVNVTVDLSLDSLPSGPVIDLSGMYDIRDSLIMPDVVNQTLNGGGNQFNVDQVNNLVDNDHLSDPSVNFNGGGGADYWCDPSEGGSFNMDAHIHGATVSTGSLGNLDHASSGVSADAVANQSAFNQSITMGANIQFNSQTITAGHDGFTDDHHTG